MWIKIFYSAKSGKDKDKSQKKNLSRWFLVCVMWSLKTASISPSNRNSHGKKGHTKKNSSRWRKALRLEHGNFIGTPMHCKETWEPKESHQNTDYLKKKGRWELKHSLCFLQTWLQASMIRRSKFLKSF